MKLTVSKLEEFFIAQAEGRPSSFLKNYKDPAIRILIKCMSEDDDAISCLKNHETIINNIMKTYENINTRKVYLQALLWLVDNYPNLAKKVNREAYLDAWESSKMAVVESPPHEYKDLPTIDEVQTKVDATYGEDSIESLYIAFFREAPMRLDYKGILIYDNSGDVPDDAEKFIVLETKKLTMRKYHKTSKRYGVAEYHLSDELVAKIQESLQKYERQELIIFSNSNPSKAIGQLLRAAGFDMTLNGLRHIMSGSAKTIEEKVEMARKMKHSPNTSKIYRSQMIVNVPEDRRQEVEELIQDYLSNL